MMSRRMILIGTMSATLQVCRRPTCFCGGRLLHVGGVGVQMMIKLEDIYHRYL
jgi:hypothetical protein